MYLNAHQLTSYMCIHSRTLFNTSDTGVFPRLETKKLLRLYHICASFMKHLVIEAQSSVSIVKSIISLHSYHV